MTEFKALIDYFGGLGGTAVIIAVAIAVWRGYLFLPRERDALVKQLEAEKAEQIAQLQFERDTAAKLLKESKEREQKWEAIALRGMKIADVATVIAQQSAAPATTATPDPRAA